MSDPLRDSIVDLTQRLVRTPSRGGIDEYGSVFSVAADWLGQRGIGHRVLAGDGGEPVALVAEVSGEPEPTYVLNATIDTAGFGDEEAWTEPPTSGVIRDGWLYGRGSADSKVGAAIFCHVIAHWLGHSERLRGTLALILDADEHTGNFGGIRRGLEERGADTVAGVFIGYPGIERIAVGARGFERGVVTVHGISAHSGSGSSRGVNAITRAARLIGRLAEAELPEAVSGTFPLPPKLSVTMIEGGYGFSEVPDRCRINVDVRLTPTFGKERARELLTELVRASDAELGGAAPDTEIEWCGGWPAYRLSDESTLVRSLLDAARAVVGPSIEPVVVGPSNVGNLLSQMGIEATCGFGVRYRGAHGTDECIDVGTIRPVFEAYRDAVGKLLAADGRGFEPRSK